jgi:hypothetical protein
MPVNLTKQLLTASEVNQEFGFARGTLISYEQQGILNPDRTPGGQRRYRREDIATLTQREMHAKPTDRPQFTELGTTGLTRWGGSVYEEQIRELQGASGRSIYREMRLNDPVIAATFFAIEGAMKQAMWRVKPFSEQTVDKECATFVDECLNDQSFSWEDTLDFILSMLEQGFSIVEPVYKRRLGLNPPAYTKDPASSKYYDGRVGWRKWAPRPANSLAFGNEWVFDDSGGIQGCNQADPNGKSVFIPIDRMLLFRTTVAPANSPEGISICRASYIPYYYSKNFQEIEGIGVERDLAGIPVFYLGNDCTLSGTNSDFELAKDAGVNLRSDEQTCLVVPHAKMGMAPEGQGMLLELLSSNSSRSHDVSAIIERYDKRKALSVLAQFVMLGMDRTGSYALSQSQVDLFSLAISSWLRKIAAVINMYAIPKLLSYNSFPGINGLPQLVPSEVGLPNLEQVGWYINNLVGAEVITPDAELERHLRQLAGFPQMTEEANGGKSRAKQKVPNMRDTALILRRVILALKELPGFEGMNDEQLTAMLTPLVEELRQAIEIETGEKVPIVTIDTNAPTSATDAVGTARTPSSNEDELVRRIVSTVRSRSSK